MQDNVFDHAIYKLFVQVFREKKKLFRFKAEKALIEE